VKSPAGTAVAMTDGVAPLRVDCRNELGEAPLWCKSSGTLYWIDVVKPGRVFHWKAGSRRVDFWSFDDMVTGLNLIEGGGLLVHGRNRLWHFDPATQARRPVFCLPATDASMRFNDGHCDQAGRLWVGTMSNNIDGSGAALDVVDGNGQICVVSGGAARMIDARLGCPNAICWSPDARSFYIADSCDGWLYSYNFDAAAGSISDRRPFFYLDGFGVPDGAAVDRDGYIWNARWGAGAVIRISPDGSLDRVVRLPVSQPTACCFGDDDRRTLYITTARFSLNPERLQAEPLAGGVFSIRLDVAGIDTPAFVADGGANGTNDASGADGADGGGALNAAPVSRRFSISLDGIYENYSD
jgi:sugar lactone lactonase YvrE